MFFYLLNNSSIILKEKKELKNIKIVIYGTICYIVSHIIINSSFNSLMTYYWILLILDCIIMYLLSNVETNGKVIINKNIIDSQLLDNQVNETVADVQEQTPEQNDTNTVTYSDNIVYEKVNLKNYDSEVELNKLLGDL